MRLIHNPEIFRLTVTLLILLVLSLALAFALSQAGLYHFHRTMAESQAAIVGAVLEQYPDAESGIIRQIKAADEAAAERGIEVLSRYGVTEGELMPHIGLMQDNARFQTALYITLALAVFLPPAAVFALFLNRHYNIIRGVNRYIHHITEGNLQLDLRDNREGEISILKNEIYKITAMLKEQTEQLKQEKVRLADSIADISHQLKTPMTSLSVLTDLLEEDPEEDVRKEFLQRIRSQLNRMEWLVTSLLKLSRLDAGTVTMKRESFPVRMLMDKALEPISIPLEVKRIDVTMTGGDDVRLKADFAWTREALVNILKNCMEHTPEQGVIRIAWEDNPIFTKITVADNGEGIDPEDLPYIFQRFYKGQNASSDSVGIGLAMAYAIVRKQGGDITVESRKGSGTTFTVTFYKQTV